MIKPSPICCPNCCSTTFDVCGATASGKWLLPPLSDRYKHQIRLETQGPGDRR